MTQAEILTGIDEHCTKFFDGHDRTVWSWSLGPIVDLAPWFKVLRYTPGPRTGLWAYVSVGASLFSEPGTTFGRGGFGVVYVAETEKRKFRTSPFPGVWTPFAKNSCL